MRITITADGGSPVTLCDHGRGGPSGLTPVALRNVDVLQFVLGQYAKPKNRGNTLNQLTFSVSKQHASYTAAQLYIFTLEETLPSTGELDIELEDQQTHLVARNATLEYTVLPLLGVMSTVTYTIKYGKLSRVAQVVGQTGNPILTEEGHKIFVNKGDS